MDKNSQKTGEYPPYAGSDEVWPLPWQLSPDQLELRDANGFTVLKAWNGHANILYAHKAVNSHAELERERDALDRALRLALSRAQVDRMLELQRQGFTGTIYEAWDRGLMPKEYRPAWELLKDETLRQTDSATK